MIKLQKLRNDRPNDFPKLFGTSQQIISNEIVDDTEIKLYLDIED